MEKWTYRNTTKKKIQQVESCWKKMVICICIDVYKIYDVFDNDELFEWLSGIKYTKLNIIKEVVEK